MRFVLTEQLNKVVRFVLIAQVSPIIINCQMKLRTLLSEWE